MSDIDEDDISTGVNKETRTGKQVIVIFDKASLETVKSKKGDYELLNCDDHLSLMKKYNKDPALYRPDIIHQELMAVLDSPMNKAGLISK
jgi:rRNA small subunit pseudouridine methyltransferase Nep1